MNKIVNKENIQDLPKAITNENLHLFPQDIKDIYQALEEKEHDIKVPTKYLPAQKRHIIAQTKKIFSEHPDTPFVKVLIQNLETLPTWLPVYNVLDVTTCIGEEWRKLQLKKQDRKATLVKEDVLRP